MVGDLRHGQPPFRRRRGRARAPRAPLVWVHDYQLQLVPRMLRELRPDLTIGFFNHIPFPAYGIYSQLPWRRQIARGAARRRRDRLPARRGCRQLLPRGAPPCSATRHQGLRASPCRDEPTAATPPRRGREGSSRSRSTRELSRRSRGDPMCRNAPADPREPRQPEDHHARRRPPRLHQGHPAPPQGVRRAARRRRGSVEDVTLVQVASPSRERVAHLPAAARRDRTHRRPDQRRLRHDGPHRRSAICTTATRARRWSRSSSPPTSCSSPRCATA